jgi:hypothetical protein
LIHVGILGAGALGLSYAAALATAGAKVTLQLRRGGSGSYRIERRFGRAERLQFETTASLPVCDVLFVALRAENVDDALLAELERAQVPIVSVSPMLSRLELERWQRLPYFVGAAPALVAALKGDVVEYWSPPLQATTVDARGQSFASVSELVTLLNRGKVPTRFRSNVAERTRATTLAFFPLQNALLLRPRIADWRRDAEWLRRVARGFAVARRVALRLSRIDLEPRLAIWALSQRWGVWAFSLLAPNLVPQLAEFLSAHFGHKLEAQTTMFARVLSDEAESYGLSPSELSELLLGAGGP